MAITLRDYQQDAVDKTMESLINIKGNPVIEMATGLGKSVVIAGLAAACRAKWCSINVLVLCHRAKLVEQDAEKFLAFGIIPSVFCAELNRKEIGQFTVATIGSVAAAIKRAERLGLPNPFGDVHLVFVDEVQTINNADEGQYREVLRSLPNAKKGGLSATPYRMKGGAVYGPNRLFSHRCFKMGFGEGVRRGFLTPPVNYDANWEDKYDDIRITAGDFNQRDMNAHYFKLVQRSCVDLVHRMKDRNYILVFACSIEHAEAITKQLCDLGEQARVYHSELSLIEDKMVINDFQNRRFKYLVSVDKLGVGFDAPFIDGLAMMRPTMSRGLAIQMLGRGSRLYEGKANFLVADYAGNIVRHNLLEPDLYDVPVEEIKKVRKGGGDAPVKKCPNCDMLCATRIVVCQCGYKFPPKISVVAAYDEAKATEKEIEIKGWRCQVESNDKHSYVSLFLAEDENAHIGFDMSSVYKFCFFPEDTGYSKTKSILAFSKLFGSNSMPPENTCASWVLCLDAMEGKYTTAKICREGKFWKLLEVK